MSKQFHIVVIGNLSKYSSLYKFLGEEFQKITQSGIPCALLTESLFDTTVDECIAALEQDLTRAEMIKDTIPAINSLYRKNNRGEQYLPRKEMSRIQDHIANFLGIQSPLDLLVMSNRDYQEVSIIGVQSLFAERTNKEKKDLFTQLKKQQIPVGGINSVEELPIRAEEEKPYYEKELSRVQNKAIKSLDFLSNSMANGGIIIILTLPFRCRRLSAYIKNNWKERFPQISLGIETINYQSDVAANYAEHIQHIESIIPPENRKIQRLIDSLPYKVAPGITTGKNFSIPELSVSIDNLITVYKKALGLQEAPLRASAFGKNFFSPLSTHDSLLRAMEKKLPKQTKTLTAMKEKDYSLVLRNLCNFGQTRLVRLFLEASEELAIDFFAKSSNGNTAADWFAASNANQADKVEIAQIFESKIAAKKAETNEELPSFFFELD